MVARLAVLALATAALAQLLNLWPLPSEAAAQSVAFWAKMKSDAEAIDLSQSPRPESDAKAKAEIIQASDVVLANPDGLLLGARIHWALWFGSAAVAALAGFALVRRWRYWPLLAVASAATFFWLQQPLKAFRLFYVDGRLDLHHGISQLEFMSQYPASFWTMVLVSALVPLLLAAVVVYALFTVYGTLRAKRVPNAP